MVWSSRAAGLFSFRMRPQGWITAVCWLDQGGHHLCRVEIIIYSIEELLSTSCIPLSDLLGLDSVYYCYHVVWSNTQPDGGLGISLETITEQGS